MQDSITHEALEALAQEYRLTMDKDIVHSWGGDAARALADIADALRTGQLIHAVPSGPDRYPLRACVWKRQPYDGCPQGEWVLEIEDQINDMSFVSRHTEPLTTPPEEVPGLPSLYASQPSGDEVEAVARIVRQLIENCQAQRDEWFSEGVDTADALHFVGELQADLTSTLTLAQACLKGER